MSQLAPVLLPQTSLVTSWWTASPLHERPQVPTQELGMVMRCFPTERRETEEAGLVWGGWGVGCWTGPACKISILLGWGSTHPRQEPQAQLCLSRGTMAQESSSSFLWSILLRVPDRDRKGETRPCQVSLLMDYWWIVSIQQYSSPLVEGDESRQEAQCGDMHHIRGVWWIL